MAVYCDTNLLVRLYAEMPDSDEIARRFAGLRQGGKSRLPITWLHQIELANALQQLVFLARRGQGIRMTPEKAALALADFEDDLTEGDGLMLTPIAAVELVRTCRDLSLRHTGTHGFRAYDIAHVASALLLGCRTFWSRDAKASQLAALEGLETW